MTHRFTPTIPPILRLLMAAVLALGTVAGCEDGLLPDDGLDPGSEPACEGEDCEPEPGEPEPEPGEPEPEPEPGEPEPAPCGIEICDGDDDDCDGAIDEEIEALPCELHACKGVLACSGGELTCEVPEIADDDDCDDVDDDCDGDIDEHFVPGACGEGACLRPAVCIGGEVVCEPGVPDAGDDCDGVDNDCDGDIDEHPSPVECGRGSCRRPAACIDGAHACEPGDEIPDDNCDGNDDDCDGEVDEGYVPEICGVGACQGESACIDGAEGPCVAGAAGEEVCDLADNDCDGVVDEGFERLLEPVLIDRGPAGTGAPSLAFSDGDLAVVWENSTANDHLRFGVVDARGAVNAHVALPTLAGSPRTSSLARNEDGAWAVLSPYGGVLGLHTVRPPQVFDVGEGFGFEGDGNLIPRPQGFWVRQQESAEPHRLTIRAVGADGAMDGPVVAVGRGIGDAHLWPEPGGGFGMVWHDRNAPLLYFRRYDAAGAPLIARVDIPSVDGKCLGLASSGEHYLLVWARGEPAENRQLQSALVNLDGQVVHGAIAGLDVTPGTDPRVDWTGRDFMVTYRDPLTNRSLVARRVSPQAEAGPPLIVSPPGTRARQQYSAAWTSRGMAWAWTDVVGDQNDVFVRRVADMCQVECALDVLLEADVTCDGIDDDCDGIADEDYVSQPCEDAPCGGHTQCDGGEEACVAAESADEVCDGADNDCDGQIDEVTAETIRLDEPAGEVGEVHIARHGETIAAGWAMMDDDGVSTVNMDLFTLEGQSLGRREVLRDHAGGDVAVVGGQLVVTARTPSSDIGGDILLYREQADGGFAATRLEQGGCNYIPYLESGPLGHLVTHRNCQQQALVHWVSLAGNVLARRQFPGASPWKDAMSYWLGDRVLSVWRTGGDAPDQRKSHWLTLWNDEFANHDGARPILDVGQFHALNGSGARHQSAWSGLGSLAHAGVRNLIGRSEGFVLLLDELGLPLIAPIVLSGEAVPSTVGVHWSEVAGVFVVVWTTVQDQGDGTMWAAALTPDGALGPPSALASVEYFVEPGRARTPRPSITDVANRLAVGYSSGPEGASAPHIAHLPIACLVQRLDACIEAPDRPTCEGFVDRR